MTGCPGWRAGYGCCREREHSYDHRSRPPIRSLVDYARHRTSPGVGISPNTPLARGRPIAPQSSMRSLVEQSARRSTTTCAPNSSSMRLGWRSPDENPVGSPPSGIPITATRSPRGRSHDDWVDAGIVPSMGSVGDCYDNSAMKSFWGYDATRTSQLQNPRNPGRAGHDNLRVDRTLVQSYNPLRRHSSIGMLSPADYEAAHTPPDHDH
jgi:hypothetical protein